MITHVYLRAKAFVSLRVMIIATAVVIMLVNQDVRPVVLVIVKLNVHANALLNAITHVLTLAQVIVQAHPCHMQYTNQV